MHYVYIIHSEIAKRYYVGETAFPDNRLIEHNTGKYSGASTRIGTDWKICKLIACLQRTDALKVEKYIKTMKSSKFIGQLVFNVDFFERFKEVMLEKYTIKVI